MSTIAAIVLAAGKGTRLKCEAENKVSLPLAGKPMISYTIDTLNQLDLNQIYIVVGFQQESVKKSLGSQYAYVYQKKRLGTGHAVLTAVQNIKKLPEHFLVLNGDDSAFYHALDLKKLIQKHLSEKADLSLITLWLDSPGQLGRIVRDKHGQVKAIVEYKNAKPAIRKIKEVNTATYCFSRRFLTRFLKKIKKNPLTHEYYLTDLLALAVKHHQKVCSVTLQNPKHFLGINTLADLNQAKKRMNKK